MRSWRSMRVSRSFLACRKAAISAGSARCAPASDKRLIQAMRAETSETAGRPFDVGGPDVLSYAEMMRRVAKLQGRSILVLPVPLLSPNLS